MTSADSDRQKLTQLRKLLIQHFSLDELRVLCFDLGLEYEDLPGDTKTTKMHGLIEYLQRRGEFARLLQVAAEHRSNVAWPSFSSNGDGVDIPGLSDNNLLASYVHKKTGLVMLLVPAGEFLCGREKLLKFLPNFWMSRTLVTHAQYAKFVRATGHNSPTLWRNDKYPKSLENHPIVNVSWDDAVAFCKWARLQLPTDEQWEKAARGPSGRSFPWGDEWRPYCNTSDAGIGTTTSVGYYSPFGDSPYGCADMSGNVWEWTNSWFDEEKKFRILRGGSWTHDYTFADLSVPDYDYPWVAYDHVGFRVVSPVVSGF